MTERIDHASEARRLLEKVAVFEDQHLEVAMTSAKVHATLALVEQQRIANVIALAGLEMQSPLRHLAIQPDGEYSIDVKDHLKEALNLD